MDVREELLESLLCYLELQDWVELLTVTQDTCTLECYGGRAQLERLAEKVTTVHAALEWCNKHSQSLSNKQIMQVCKDIRCLLSIHDDRRFTARSVARILHGIASPKLPSPGVGDGAALLEEPS